jgi:hypothetical protein
MGRTACTEPQCLYSRAIPLLPLWAVRPVQNLSACTRAHFTFAINIPVRAALASVDSKGLITQDASHYQFQLPVGPQDDPPLSISRISTLKQVPRAYVDGLCSPRWLYLLNEGVVIKRLQQPIKCY